MDEDILKQLWLGSSKEQNIEINAKKLIESINLKLSKMNKGIKRRDIQEISIAVLLIPIFGWWFLVMPQVLAKIGAAIIFINCILVIIKLIRARKVSVNEETASQIKYHLMVSLQRLRNQINLHSTMFWWYLLPFFIGVICFFYAFVNSILANAIYTFIVAVLYSYIWYLNQRFVKKYLKPLEKNIINALSELSE